MAQLTAKKFAKEIAIGVLLIQSLCALGNIVAGQGNGRLKVFGHLMTSREFMRNKKAAAHTSFIVET